VCAGRPGVDVRMSDHTSHESASTVGYNRAAVSHLLGIYPWQQWEDMLDWLRSEGPNDPHLNPDEYRALRQDAERAQAAGVPFTNDLDHVWAELRRHHKPAG
jgi:hypothetical protein